MNEYVCYTCAFITLPNKMNTVFFYFISTTNDNNKQVVYIDGKPSLLFISFLYFHFFYSILLTCIWFDFQLTSWAVSYLNQAPKLDLSLRYYTRIKHLYLWFIVPTPIDWKSINWTLYPLSLSSFFFLLSTHYPLLFFIFLFSSCFTYHTKIMGSLCCRPRRENGFVTYPRPYR